MVQITNAKKEWVRCEGCGHKLFRVSEDFQMVGYIEIKCHSCKAINVLNVKGGEDSEQ